MQVVEIPQVDQGHTIKPSWVPSSQLLPETREEIIVRPVIYCKCGQLLPIRIHHILPDGTVQPSFYHKEGCKWHVYLKLMDWPDLEFFPTHDRPK